MSKSIELKIGNVKRQIRTRKQMYLAAGFLTILILAASIGITYGWVLGLSITSLILGIVALVCVVASAMDYERFNDLKHELDKLKAELDRHYESEVNSYRHSSSFVPNAPLPIFSYTKTTKTTKPERLSKIS